MAADEGYRTIVILTSDNDPLYEQTLGRVREAFPGIDILGKSDFKDIDRFLGRIKGATTAIVATKNASILKTLNQNFQKGNLKGLSCLIIDDEADQASLNTKAAKDDGTVSPINEQIAKFRTFFDKNTYLQVTATPQALFLQAPNHEFRPKFTVLSHPGFDYVGGEDFFGDNSKLVNEFDRNDITTLSPGAQPTPQLNMPGSLLRALDTFVVAATFKRHQDASQNSAFLCHVSTRKADHNHIVDLLQRYRVDLADGARTKDPALIKRLETACADLGSTHPALATMPFDTLLGKVAFYAPGTNVKLVNGDTDEDVAVRSPYCLFVGGNKLGRGVTIRNLLVSYYGRHPKQPQADTVLQHARMYGYRRKDIGLLRLFLTSELHVVFRAINKMEKSLRDLIASKPSEEFRAVFLSAGLQATRRNILAPGAVGVYAGGGIYNPAQVLRDVTVTGATTKLDARVQKFASKTFHEVSIDELRDLIALTVPDPAASEKIWDPVAVAESLAQFARLHRQKTGYLYLDRGRGLSAKRRETQGILDGGEAGKVPADKLTLFLLKVQGGGAVEAWWPQIRFPAGRYAFAFAI
ncbi:MAG: Z1 domain-containing protein [Vicinamibacteria bacterium]